MLLKHLYDLAHSPSRSILEDLAFLPKAVRWMIELDTHGHLVGQGLSATGDEKRGKEFSCPQTTRNKNVGGVAEFLADNLTGIFGLDPNPDAPLSAERRTDRDINNARKRDDFWQQIKEAAAATGSLELQAMLCFRGEVSNPPSFLRWGLSAEPRKDEKSGWWIRTASGNETKLGPDNFSFVVGGKALIEDEKLCEYWRQMHAREVESAEADAQRGLCLVTGQDGVSIASTHNPTIKGIPGTQQSGAKIVSFEKSAQAFSSFGFQQSLNAPTSIAAATAYCTAMNWLLKRPDHYLRIGQTALCYWARDSEEASGVFARLMQRPDPQSIRNFIRSPFAGIPYDLARNDRFFAVTLAGNKGRIAVRHWVQVPLVEAMENFRRWFTDLEIFLPLRPTDAKRKGSERTDGASDKDTMPPLAIYRLACTIVREAKDLSPDMPAQLYRAALEGTAPSIAMLKPILDQLHSKLVRDDRYSLIFDESRFGLLKLILNRNRKENIMEIKPRLTADTDDPAYNCGRLLAVLAASQAKAHDYKLEGAGVTERYFGTASVSPASVFPLLLRLNRHHLNKIAKSDRWAGHEYFLQQHIESVLVLFKAPKPGLPPIFPRTLDLQAQGRFALGFYQQSAEDAAARQAKSETKTK